MRSSCRRPRSSTSPASSSPATSGSGSTSQPATGVTSRPGRSWTRRTSPTGTSIALHHWLDQEQGSEHVAAYLHAVDLTGFDPNAPPPKTEWFWSIVDAGRAPEESELATLLDSMSECPGEGGVAGRRHAGATRRRREQRSGEWSSRGTGQERLRVLARGPQESAPDPASAWKPLATSPSATTARKMVYGGWAARAWWSTRSGNWSGETSLPR